VQKRAASLWTAQASGRGNLALSGFMTCNQGGREHRAGAGEARLVAFQPDGQDLANDAFLDIVAQGFDAGIRLDEAVQHDMIAMRLTRPFNAMLAASSAYLDAKGMPTTIADSS
jgi:hypothetical protein